MNIQKFKSMKQLISKKVEIIIQLEKENKSAYFEITKNILDSLFIDNQDEAKALLNSLQDKQDSLITGTIENTKLLIQACDIQNKKLVELMQTVSEKQKSDILKLHYDVEAIVLDLKTLLTLLLEKLDLLEELLTMEEISGKKIDTLIKELHQELKGRE